MSWDAPAQRTLNSARALFTASDLGWFDALGAPWSGDPWAAFESLIRETLTATGDDAPVAPPADPVLPAVAPLRPPARAVSVPMAQQRADAAASMSATGRPALPMTPMPRLDPLLPPALAPAAAPTGRPAAGRAARVAALASLRSPAVSAKASLLAFENAAATPARLWPDTAQPARGVEAALPAAAPAPSARILRLPEAPRAAGVAGERAAPVARLRLPLRRVEATAAAAPAATSSAVTETAPSRRTRLVDGLPALRGLLQAAVAESHQHQALGATDPTTPAVAAVPPAPSSVAAVAPLRALPQLDAVAEDMLVDRIADRLQERLREQALRQFGFTGGLS